MIADKLTGRLYSDLLAFRDYGETGDGWFHQPPTGNPVVLEQGCEKSVEVYRDGSEICVLQVTKYMRVPACLERGPAKSQRSSKSQTIKITSFITLTKNSRWVEIDTVIENTALDHKMTVNFPSGLNTDTYEADQPFAIVRRRAGSPAETGGWKEYDRGSHAFTSLVMRRDENGEGLAFLSRGGLHECIAHTDSAGTLEITLFRSFGTTFLTDGEPDGQLSGELRFSFALLPLNGRITNGDIVKMKNRYVNMPFAYTVRGSDKAADLQRMPGFSLESNNIVLSVLRPSRVQEFICIRLVNYGDTYEEARLTCSVSIAEVYKTDLLETEREAIPFSENEFRYQLEPYKIATFLVKLHI
jgi:alpha-mannosidase